MKLQWHFEIDECLFDALTQCASFTRVPCHERHLIQTRWASYGLFCALASPNRADVCRDCGIGIMARAACTPSFPVLFWPSTVRQCVREGTDQGRQMAAAGIATTESRRCSRKGSRVDDTTNSYVHDAKITDQSPI